MSTTAKFQVEYQQFLDPLGKLVAPLPAFVENPASLIPFYKSMVQIRAYDSKAIALQRTGQIGTFASLLGKEAIDVGVGAAMAKDDVLLCTYRENGVQIMRGVTMCELFLYWGGDERGSDFAGPRHDFPTCVTIASQCLHAVGVGYAIKLRKQPRVAVCMLGDGATSKGDFYEGINATGTWRLPVVFVVTNNQWAISVPLKMQTAAQTLAQKAIAAGFDGQQVDGNDVIAVHHAVREALAKARAGGGPTLIEALTYRLGDHTTADDASRYRPAEEVAEAWKREPVLRLRNFLLNSQVWDKAQEDELLKQCNENVQSAAQAYLDTPVAAVNQMFDRLYATPAPAYAAQRATILASVSDDGTDRTR